MCVYDSYIFRQIVFARYFFYSGYIGKLRLQIPVRYIKSQPWVIQIDQLYVVAGPAQPAPVSSTIYRIVYCV
jgi:hypothetical protein